VAVKMGFGEVYPVTGQTYSRKVDAQVLDVLSGVAKAPRKRLPTCGCCKARKEVEEPFEATRSAPSAMAYNAQSDAHLAHVRLARS